jgi:hypothetical protein
MARFKDFDAAEAERTGDPIHFKMGGRDWQAAHVNAANFLAFARHSAEGGDRAILGFDDYITSTLPENQREDFHAMLGESDIQLGTLMELAQWIVEQATGNPTDGASLSPEAPPKTTGPPRRFSLDPISAPQDSLSVAG